MSRVLGTLAILLTLVIAPAAAQNTWTLDSALAYFHSFPEEQCVVVRQPEAPVALHGCRAKFDAVDEPGELVPQIVHYVEYFNHASPDEGDLFSVEFLFVDFTAFNEVLDVGTGTDVERVRRALRGSGEWVTDQRTGHRLFATLCFLTRARFASGLIWEADLERLVEAVRRIVRDPVAVEKAIEELRETARQS